MDIDSIETFKSRVDLLVNSLRKEIIEGKLRPQERIVEEAVAKRFNISRSPIREAFRILEAKGLVNNVPRKGVCVSDIRLEDVEAIYAIRPCLEGLAAKFACRNASEADLDRLSGIVDEMEVAADRNDFQLYFRLNKEFHEGIYNLARNKYLLQTLQMLSDFSLRHTFIHLAHLRRLKGSQKGHFKLLEAFRAKDEKKAERTRYKQIERRGKFLIERMSLKFT